MLPNLTQPKRIPLSKLHGETEEMAAERDRLVKAVLRSSARKELSAIVRLAVEVANRADDFADRHGHGCRCSFCKHQRLHPLDEANLQADLRSLAHIVAMLAGAIDSGTILEGR
jgi:hypothetical protein